MGSFGGARAPRRRACGGAERSGCAQPAPVEGGRVGRGPYRTEGFACSAACAHRSADHEVHEGREGTKGDRAGGARIGVQPRTVGPDAPKRRRSAGSTRLRSKAPRGCGVRVGVAASTGSPRSDALGQVDDEQDDEDGAEDAAEEGHGVAFREGEKPRRRRRWFPDASRPPSPRPQSGGSRTPVIDRSQEADRRPLAACRRDLGSAGPGPGEVASGPDAVGEALRLNTEREEKEEDTETAAGPERSRRGSRRPMKSPRACTPRCRSGPAPFAPAFVFSVCSSLSSLSVVQRSAARTATKT